jgi:hypothetical protein
MNPIVTIQSGEIWQYQVVAYDLGDGSSLTFRAANADECGEGYVPTPNFQITSGGLITYDPRPGSW